MPTHCCRASGPIITVNARGDVSRHPLERSLDRSRRRWRRTTSPRSTAQCESSPRPPQRPELHLRLTLGPGDCIVFDNTRVLHARTAFEGGSGARHLQGCYADLDGLASTVAVLERQRR